MESDAPKAGRFSSAFALGFRLSGVGLVAKLSIAIVVLTVVGAVVVALALLKGQAPPLALVPGLTGAAIAWGGGFTFAVAAAAHVFDRDAASGIRGLARTRGVSQRTYVAGRVAGLAVALGLLVVLGTLVTGGVCAAIAGSARHAVLRTTLATVPYAIGFSIVLAPLAAATLGSRSRSRGYLALLAILIVPEIAQDSLEAIPERWRSLVGLPSAMATLRDALTPAHFDGPLAAAAAAVLFVVAVVAYAFALEAAAQAARAENAG